MHKTSVALSIVMALVAPAVLDARLAHARSADRGDGGSCTTGGICLEVTLALDNGDPNQCGTADTLDVSVGDQVNFCYTVGNDPGDRIVAVPVELTVN